MHTHTYIRPLYFTLHANTYLGSRSTANCSPSNPRRRARLNFSDRVTPRDASSRSCQNFRHEESRTDPKLTEASLNVRILYRGCVNPTLLFFLWLPCFKCGVNVPPKSYIYVPTVLSLSVVGNWKKMLRWPAVANYSYKCAWSISIFCQGKVRIWRGMIIIDVYSVKGLCTKDGY
jgi:hypothetical protein